MGNRLVLSISLTVLAIALTLAFFTISCRSQNTTRSPQAISLRAAALKSQVSLEQALGKRRSVRSYSSEPLTLQEVSQLLWAAQGITDPATGHRTAPSAMATYPLTVYLVAGNVKGLSPGIYRYVPKGHKLESVTSGDSRDALAKAAMGQDTPRRAPAVLVITGNYSITRGRCGDMAQRYVHIEAGAAGQNVLLQAAALNLGAVGMGGISDDQVREVLGASKDETPLYVIPVGMPK